jgi:hypothetical protein
MSVPDYEIGMIVESILRSVMRNAHSSVLGVISNAVLEAQVKQAGNVQLTTIRWIIWSRFNIMT